MFSVSSKSWNTNVFENDKCFVLVLLQSIYEKQPYYLPGWKGCTTFEKYTVKELWFIWILLSGYGQGSLFHPFVLSAFVHRVLVVPRRNDEIDAQR